MKYGYARVSTKSQEDNTSLNQQKSWLMEQGVSPDNIYWEVASGKDNDRKQFQEVLSKLKHGDELIVNKLDRFARSIEHGIREINSLLAKGVIVNVGNFKRIDPTDNKDPIQNAMLSMMLTFAQLEREMIVMRTQEGKAIAKQREDFREGRPSVHKKKAIEHALELLATHTYKEVTEKTGISKSTLIRAKKKADQI
ncbi:recombinase family protein [Niallia taxi]|uniref:recombinase family protein n=1 Tax=Niallia taxi TaxID=2499688 RepID=UPI0029351DF7|nr:recombinase family protein [Niallia taxi]WOD61773.1 recombinase family protein [Niallia taxi]